MAWRFVSARIRPSRFRPGFATLVILIVGGSLLSLRISHRLLVDKDPEGQYLHSTLSWGPSAAFCNRASPPLVCAHGGNTELAFPNTVAAIRAVMTTGAACVEIDVSRTADNVLVAVHGRDLARLLGSNSAVVGEFTADEIFSLDTGNEDHIPSFEVAIKAALDSSLSLITVGRL
mmetsp:Transcript_7367/g.13972  ORF Transcript_7367/g.13972 Transcript_7367/m.13972 type:complete len:175 (-) Transcript_7367:567-1091(-)